MSCILVTGANGFVGNKLCQELIDKGHTVHAITRQPYKGTSSTEYRNFTINEIGSDTQWSEALANVECIVHLAARVHVMEDSSTNPLAEYRETNTNGTMALARQALAAGVKRFVYISSIKVNGESTALNKPFTDKDDCNPDDPYGLSKYEAENQLFELAGSSRMEVVIIRPPLVYGPGVKANFLSMIRWVNKGVPLPLGAIYNKRSLVALDNLVSLIVVCTEHKAAANEVFLVSDGQDLSLTQLLQAMAKALGKPSRLLPVPAFAIRLAAAFLGKRDISRRLLDSLQVDISKTKNLLNWQPPVSVEAALKVTADDFKEKSQ